MCPIKPLIQPPIKHYDNYLETSIHGTPNKKSLTEIFKKLPNEKTSNAEKEKEINIALSAFLS
jgi:hypothetical protein